MTAETPDEALVLDARRGDDQAFATLYRRHVRRVHRRLVALTGPGDHIEDLLQQAFLELHRSLPGFRGECRLSTWLTRIVINVAAQYRRRNRRKPPPETGLKDTDLRQEATQPDHVAASQAWQMLGRLPDKLRVPLVLRDVEEMTLDEIAKATATPLSTVVSRLAKAHRLVLRDLTNGRER